MHQGTSLTSITSPNAGDTISAFAALAGNITSINTNRHNIDSGNYTDTTSSSNGSGSWTTSTVHEFTLTFAGGDEARYYYNCGGSTRLTFSRSGGTSHTKNTEWANLATACGTVVFAVQGTTKSGGSGSTNILATTIGYQDMTTSYQSIFKQFEGDNPYTANYILVEVKTNANDDSIDVKAGFDGNALNKEMVLWNNGIYYSVVYSKDELGKFSSLWDNIQTNFLSNNEIVPLVENNEPISQGDVFLNGFIDSALKQGLIKKVRVKDDN